MRYTNFFDTTAATPALDPSGGPSVPEGRGRAAGGAGGVGAVKVGGLGEGAEAVLLAAAPLVDGPAEELEVLLVERRDGVREGAVSVHLGVPARSGAHPAGLSPNKSRVGPAANSRLAGTGWHGAPGGLCWGRFHHPFLRLLNIILYVRDA